MKHFPKITQLSSELNYNQNLFESPCFFHYAHGSQDLNQIQPRSSIFFNLSFECTVLKDNLRVMFNRNCAVFYFLLCVLSNLIWLSKLHVPYSSDLLQNLCRGGCWGVVISLSYGYKIRGYFLPCKDTQ